MRGRGVVSSCATPEALIGTAMSKRKKLAIISSYNENCGNASYTFALKAGFSDHLDVDVIALDLFLLQKTGRVFRQQGDRHIERIALSLKNYDYVNIQFEAGLFGKTAKDIQRRIFILMNAANNLILTMHRIDVAQLGWKQMLFSLIAAPARGWSLPRVRTFEHLYANMVEECKIMSRTKNVWIAVHTKRERRIVQEFFQFKNCFDYPLTFLSRAERESAWSAHDKDAFKAKHGFKPDQKIVGAFGYISEYKGYEALVRALPLLPDNYILAIFGSQHPQSVRPRTELDKYLGKLITEIETTTNDVVRAKALRLRALRGTAVPEADATKFLRYDLIDRVRFMGNLPDPEFIEALRLCDAVVLPYVEVGQSMSGVAALGLESGANLFCSNNLAFNEFKKYFGETFHAFDVGNHIEVAQKIASRYDDYKTRRDEVHAKFNLEGNIAKHLEAFENGVREQNGTLATLSRPAQATESSLGQAA